MSAPAISAEELRRALPLAAAIDALQEALREPGLPAGPPRTAVDCAPGQLLLMPAAGRVGAGVKLVTVQPENPGRGRPLIGGAYVLFRARTLELRAVLDGAELTRLRTAAVSALATRLLARPDARTLVVFGAGVQARAHVEAMRAVRPIERLVVVAPRGAEAVAHDARRAGLDASVGTPDAVERADVVCTCTTSAEPVFDGRRLAGAAHVNAMGSYQPATREVDSEAVARSSVVVETRAAGLTAGDLAIPAREGRLDPADVVELVSLVCGSAPRTTSGAPTLFKSVGLALEDLIVAAAAADRLGLP